ncbi:MAG: HD domain-containing protein [Actinomycetota bacterium]
MDAHGQLTPSLDSLAFTDSVTVCRESLRRAVGVSGGPIERHSARVFFIMQQLAQEAAAPLDREVAACAAVLHDIGLYDPVAKPRLYLHHGRVAAERVIGSFSWTAQRRRLCLDAIELHHRLTPQWKKGIEVELLRLADLVDASRGLVSLGLDQGWLRQLFQAIERRGLQRELLRHSIRGAPCMTRGLLATVINTPRRTVRVDQGA